MSFITVLVQCSNLALQRLSKHAIDPSKFIELRFSFSQCCHVFEMQLNLRRTSLAQLDNVACVFYFTIFFKSFLKKVLHIQNIYIASIYKLHS
jgi:hypothetical protein